MFYKAAAVSIFVKNIPLNKRSLFHGAAPLMLFALSWLLDSCSATTDVFEKNIAIPRHEWSKTFKPEINFTIADTSSRYNIYIVVRHTDAYRFKNIWLNVNIQSPRGISKSQSLDLQLADDKKGWLGSGMDDLYEHRVLITPPQQPETLSAGTYHFQLEQLMREDPLEYVMNIGIRVEKAK